MLGLELRKSRVLLPLFVEMAAEGSVQVHLDVGESKAVRFPEEGILVLVAGRSL